MSEDSGNNHGNSTEDPDLEDELDEEIQNQLREDFEAQLQESIEQGRHALEFLREGVAPGFVQTLHSQLQALHGVDAPSPPDLVDRGVGTSSTSMGQGGGDEEDEGDNDGDMESSVDTFLEFTGSEDRDRARRYLVAAEGRLEQAVNLFLSGSPLELFEAPSRSRMNRGRVMPSNVLPSFLSQAVGGGTNSGGGSNSNSNASSPNSGGSWLYYHRQGANARTSADVESALLALGGITSVSNDEISSALDPNRIMDDSQRASAHVDALRLGVWDKTPVVGASCLRSVETAEKYFDLGLCEVISDCLPMSILAGEDGIAVRFLQLIECTMRIVCDGHSEAVGHCGWWFIPPRRSGSRRYARNSFTEMFLDRIIPENDLAGLQQMWLSENFDPSWRDRKTEAEMLACALSLGCTIEMLDMLIDPVNGCRANVNPDSDRLGSLTTPLLLAGLAPGFTKLWKRQQQKKSSENSVVPVVDETDEEFLKAKDQWSGQAVEILLDSGACIDDETLSNLNSLTDSARKLILAEQEGTRVSERLRKRSLNVERIAPTLVRSWWDHDARKYVRSLLRAIGLTKHDSTMHRSMEVLVMLIGRFRPYPYSDAVNTLGKVEYDRLMNLLQSIFTPENTDNTSLILTVRLIDALLTSTFDEQAPFSLNNSAADETKQQNIDDDDGNDDDGEPQQYLGVHAQFCLSLCRFGITSRLRHLAEIAQKQYQSEALETCARNVIEKITKCIVEELNLTEQTLLGRSAPLLDICERLRNGDVDVLETLVYMMGQGGANHGGGGAGGNGDDDEDPHHHLGHRAGSVDDLHSPRTHYSNVSASSLSPLNVYGDDGITPFEFEQSGLPSALLEFLLAKDVKEGGSEVREARMHALLSAMPPPVLAQDGADMDEEDENIVQGKKNRLKKSDTLTMDEEEDEEDDDGATGGGGSATGSGGVGPSGPGATLGRQSSLTLESVQNLAQSSLESIRTNNGNENLDTAAFTTSALYRLISKLQTVLSVHAAHNFPVLSHDSTVSSGGIRGLVNPMKISLRRDLELDRATVVYPEASELVVQVLPLTPLYEFQRQVLRAVRIADPRYVGFCRKLVGRKVLHRFQVSRESENANYQNAGLASPMKRLGSPGGASPGGRSWNSPRSPRGFHLQNPGSPDEYTLSIVLKYDPYTGAHLLQDLTGMPGKNVGTTTTIGGSTLGAGAPKKGKKRWYLLHLRDYQVLERVFDGLGNNTNEKCIEFVKEEYAMGDSSNTGSSASSSASSSSSSRNRPTHKIGSKVAVWWCGSEQLGPGWRTGKIINVDLVNGEYLYDVQYENDQLMYDEIIRVGDYVKLIDDVEELERLAQGHGGWTHDMPEYCGQVARVTSIRDTQVSTDGLGNYVYNIKALTKVPPSTQHQNAATTNTSSTTMKPESLLKESSVPQRRIFPSDAIPQLDEKHCYSVYLVPENHESISPVSSPKQQKKRQSLHEGKTKEKGKKFKLNDRIEARFNGKSRYYKGRIARVNADGTYDIAYDDGDSERGVKPELVCHIGEGPGKVVSYDFRKVFPNSAGRALFDALRREDAVLNTEYNFVTRGFEHQPDFYASFSRTLETEGKGVFAQFQTKQQAEILFDRVQRCGQSSKSSRSANVRAHVDIFPDVVIPPIVERDILGAFENIKSRVGSRHKSPPPPPGHRGQVSVRSIDYLDPLSRDEAQNENNANLMNEEDESTWLSATILGKRVSLKNDSSSTTTERQNRNSSSNNNNNNNNNEDEDVPTKQYCYTCVLDDGRVLWEVPEDRVRVAQRTSRYFPFKTTRERSEEPNTARSSNMGTASSPASERSAGFSRDGNANGEIVELTRQFTAFGNTTSYKRIQVENVDDEEEEEEEQLHIEDDNTEGEYDTDENVVAPRFEVEFYIPRSGDSGEEDEDEKQGSQEANDDAQQENNDDEDEERDEEKIKKMNIPTVLANNVDSEISMFQALFQLQSSSKTEIPTELRWRVRVVFPEDPDFEEASTTRKLRHVLPWRTPRALAFEVMHNKALTLETFCDRLVDIVPNLKEWAQNNKLVEIVQYLEGKSFNQHGVNWAAICAAYTQLCQLQTIGGPTGGDGGLAVSPIRSPTLLKKEQLFGNIKAIGDPDLDQKQILNITSDTHESGAVEGEEELYPVMTLLEECGIEAHVPGLRDTLLLLHLLYSHLVPFDEAADPLAAAFGRSLPWRSDALSSLLRDQLSDPLSIATRCFPRWISIFPREFSFLFRTKVREALFRCTSLGVSRALAWLQDELTGYKAKKKQLAHVTLEISALFKGVPDMAKYEQLQELSDRLEDELKAIEQEHCIGQLQQDLVKVNRAELLHDAELLMKQHMHQRSELVVQFLNETGAGDGVTIDFYSSVSERLQLVKENERVPLWVKLDVDEEEEQHIVSTGGLFPQPLLPIGSAGDGDGFSATIAPSNQSGLIVNTKRGSRQTALDLVSSRLEILEGKASDGHMLKGEDEDGDNSEGGVGGTDQANLNKTIRQAETRNKRVIQRFRFLGRLMAKALLDGYSVPIPISAEFFMYIIARHRNQSNETLLPISTLSLLEGDDSTMSGGAGDVTSTTAEPGAKGLIQTLYEYQQAGDVDQIKMLLDEIDLYFIDPAQKSYNKTLSVTKNATGNNSNKIMVQDEDEEEMDAGGAGMKMENGANIASLKVPGKDASASELLVYAEAASRAGCSQNDIDKALTEEGHSKLVRWKAIKSTQAIRTKIRLEKAAESSKNMVASELIPGGSSRKVTVNNVQEYLELVLSWWLGSGIEEQCDAFTSGLADVLGKDGRDALLFNFSHSELRRLLCGIDKIEWNEDDPLLGCIVPMGSYNEESPSIKMLVEVLKEFNSKERAMFLNFVTAQPRIPLSGLPQIKVYPPILENIPAIIVRVNTERAFKVGEEVELVENYRDYDDAIDGPLALGEKGIVTNVESRVRICGWWYNKQALKPVKPVVERKDYLPSNEWLHEDDHIRTVKAKAQIKAWDPTTMRITFHTSTDLAVRRTFKPGQTVELVTQDQTKLSKIPTLRIEKVIEEPQSIQMRPYLRPKATTCAKTLYLPSEYDSPAHLKEVLLGAFQDARLGGIHEA